ncbi:hypothetical protein [uncultured Streptomyces sp.]|uniref:hypothetical protein n=1 Tax=uncultured Streptomyces sp. TaxID=174707 RepID=UPI00260849BD|nr:hypothetical protein [uncultured Streptomyces sp.]
MNRLAPLRPPVALLTCCALLFAALATVLALAAQAHAYTTIGSLTLTPTSGKTDDPLFATHAETDGPCPADSLSSTLTLVDPGTGTGLILAKLKSPPSVTGPFSDDLVKGVPAVVYQSLGQRLAQAVPDGNTDGVYTIGLNCGLGTADAPAFTTLIKVEGDSWSVLEQQATGITLSTAPDPVRAGKPYTLVATVAPEGAAGKVTLSTAASENAEYTEIGQADVSGGTAEFALTAPSQAGPSYVRLAFTPTDPQRYAASQKDGFIEITAVETPTTPPPTTPAPGESEDLDVTDAEGNALDADPVLEPGDAVKITARGFTAAAVVKVDLDGGTTFADATADAEGTVKEYAFTVPDDVEDGAHTLTLGEEAADGHSVAFLFTTGGDPTDAPTDPDGDPSDTAGTGDTSGGADGGAGQGADGGSGGSDAGGPGTDSGSGSGSGTLASTGARLGTAALGGLALIAAGAVLVIHVRRKGLLSFASARH